MEKLSKSKGSNNVLNLRVKYLTDSDEHCYIGECGMMAQVIVLGVDLVFHLCLTHFAQSLDSFDVVNLVEEPSL